ncbi:MAG: nicotinate (nicotinamide) nucleotide adenylyltransferase, partial [Pygmaiobacter sp.]
MKLLLFGGTFDPPHNGHIALLQHAIDAIRPDKIVVMPAGTPPHKAASETPGSLRYAMCAAFLPVSSRVHRSRFELLRGGKSYTLNTVEHLKKRYPTAEIYLAIGSDMLLTFTEWHDYRTLLRRVVVVAQSRSDAETAAMAPAVEQLQREGGKILFLNCEVLALSSTDIREKVARGEDIVALVPPESARVIERH